ncbi:MoaF-related domain-containing protein [Psychromonas ossibalaenae]|uniref:MoaF-related domain-containing protein n=1 Tax=Psychromonas ossibalaenae TaxID=444922 RepID=UPI000376F724|nr:MoaF N-terminal domain-containing protein [Psychromonas ossibalaenae]
MKKFIASLIIIPAIFCAGVSASQGDFGGSTPKMASEKVEKSQHLLDGSIVEYQFQHGGAVRLELYDGLLKYEWTAGPMKGNNNKDLPYRSRKIADKMYMVNWYEQSKLDYITLVLNFNNNVMHASGILNIGSEKQFSTFAGGILDEVKLIEK